MRKGFKSHLLAAVFALAQFLFLTAAHAALDLDGRGENMEKTNPFKIICPLYGQNGNYMGTAETTIDPGTGAKVHVIKLLNGTLTLNTEPLSEIVIGDPRDPDFPMVIPVNDRTAKATADPDVEANKNNPNASILIVNANINLTDQNSQASGSLQKYNFLEVRCLYLMVNGRIVKCLGCHVHFDWLDD